MVGPGMLRLGMVLMAAGCRLGPEAPASTDPARLDRAWRHGPRDSALATGLACEILSSLDGRGECVVVHYRETGAEYILRLKHADRGGASSPAQHEVRLTKDGDSATVIQLAVP